MPERFPKPAGGWPLREAATALGRELSPEEERALATWLDTLVHWNAKVDLTAARSASELVDLMLADAVILGEHVPRGARVVDVGTGAGAPGLALALLRPDLAVTLVEPLAKRTAFLRTVLAAVGRADVVVLAGRGEDVADHGTLFDVAVARATLPPPAWLALARRLVDPGGQVWVLLAKEAPPPGLELVAEPAIEYVWPLTGAVRRAVKYVAP